jgi:hypothetical protein
MTFSSLSKYVVFVNSHQGNDDVMPFSLPTTKAYVEFIGMEKARAYLQCIQDVHVCGYMVDIYSG